jgi:beta-1,4-N-acetylglucosaminyltransferase
MIILISTILLALTTLLALRTWWVLASLRKEEKNHHDAMTPSSPPPHRNNNNNKPLKTLVVLGSGGHTTEMLHLIKNLNADHYAPLIYVVATTDKTSRRRVDAFGGRAPDRIYEIPRSREVGQSYLSSILTTLYSFVHAVVLVVRVRPDLVLTNGPGTCLPIVVVTLVGRILGICEGRNVFVESFCRVTRYVLTCVCLCV